ncbi:MAG: YeeE/YedE family protein [Proteobacteria bacterium]|nr:YeeE/YedE family protein [Pseudomonadota bacterium]
MTLAPFDAWHALAGGALIGAAAGGLALMNGRLAGISGVVGSLVAGGVDPGWRIAFLAGLVVAPLAWRLWAPFPGIALAPVPVLVVAGLLVGLGTRYGGGCTSGHGVCGLARASPRSLVATLVFMATGALAVFVVRHVAGY